MFETVQDFFLWGRQEDYMQGFCFVGERAEAQFRNLFLKSWHLLLNIIQIY